MTCMIKYPCSNRTSSPSLPPSTKQCWYTHVPYAFTVHYPWQHWFWGSGEQRFYYKMSQKFLYSRLWLTSSRSIFISLKKKVSSYLSIYIFFYNTAQCGEVEGFCKNGGTCLSNGSCSCQGQFHGTQCEQVSVTMCIFKAGNGQFYLHQNQCSRVNN